MKLNLFVEICRCNLFFPFLFIIMYIVYIMQFHSVSGLVNDIFSFISRVVQWFMVDDCDYNSAFVVVDFIICLSAEWAIGGQTGIHEKRELMRRWINREPKKRIIKDCPVIWSRYIYDEEELGWGTRSIWNVELEKIGNIQLEGICYFWRRVEKSRGEKPLVKRVKRQKHWSDL